LFLSICFIFTAFAGLFAAEYNEGNVRLIINEKTGAYSLYYLSDQATMRYEPLFYSGDPASSFLEVNVDGKVYRPAKSGKFRTRFEEVNENPSVAFESDFLKVRQVFTFVKTAGSDTVNGINITIILENMQIRALSVAMRVLIDTYLGEGLRKTHFVTNKQSISKETLIEGTSGEMYWISRGPKVTLMGNIVDPVDNYARLPDFVYMANWKRLNKAKWNVNYSEGRSLSYFPYFFSDSAVCYYYDSAFLEGGETAIYNIYLTAEDIPWYTGILPDVDLAPLEEEKYEDANLIMLYNLQEILNQFIQGEIYLDEEDLAEIEGTIEWLKAGDTY
jgi:hypothetical protein